MSTEGEDKPKLNILNFSNPGECEKAMSGLKRDLPYLLQYTGIVAEIRRKQFLEYVDRGFTEEQALDLCKISFI